MRDDARADANQAEIVDALRHAGCSVLSLHRVGRGCPDLIAAHHGREYLIEVKSVHGKLTPKQLEFMDNWRGVVHIVHNVEDALWAVGLMDNRYCV